MNVQEAIAFVLAMPLYDFAWYCGVIWLARLAVYAAIGGVWGFISAIYN